MSDGDDRHIAEWPDEDNIGGRLGRHLHHDPQNRRYPMRALLDNEPRPPARRRSWYSRIVYDQGATSSCTAQAAVGIAFATAPNLIAHPRTVRDLYDAVAERHDLYLRAQAIDPWPGGEGQSPHYEGTSTDAPFKALREAGHIREWRWCFGLTDVLDTLRYHGAVAVGTDWFSSMDTTDARGKVTVGGWIRGGHAYRLTFADDVNHEVVAVNSWGRTFGRNGRFRLSYDDLGRLLDAQGEAVAVVL